MAELKRNEKLDVVNILKDLDKYEPRRRGWVWREKAEDQHMGPFEYHEISKPLKQSVPLPPAKFMEDIDPQPMQTITTEIASGRFEDDIRRMRMGAWHGADHLMVIRHMDSPILTVLWKVLRRVSAVFLLQESRSELREKLSI